MAELMYRAPDEMDEDTEEDIEDLKDYVHGMMHESSPDNIVDTLLVLANSCEARSMSTCLFDTRVSEWYAKTGRAVRSMLEEIVDESACPDIRLENPLLYYPEPRQTH